MAEVKELKQLFRQMAQENARMSQQMVEQSAKMAEENAKMAQENAKLIAALAANPGVQQQQNLQPDLAATRGENWQN